MDGGKGDKGFIARRGQSVHVRARLAPRPPAARAFRHARDPLRSGLTAVVHVSGSARKNVTARWARARIESASAIAGGVWPVGPK
jgi:hypothetical protein